MNAGDKLGPYEIIVRIGAGGMGEVYRARDPRLGRDVAIKVSAEQFTERFEREARTIASLNHPNICTLYDVGPNYLVMELVEGESPKGPLPLDAAMNYARQIAAALEEAHNNGVVHRDLKPGNIKVKSDGTVKVLDFGLAKNTSPSREGVAAEDSPTISMAATQAGTILGTAAYMAPEQAKGKNVDKRADIWAFGVVLCEMLTGQRLFKGDDISEILASVIKEKPDLSAVPAQVKPLLERCLEKDPKKRLRDIGDMELLLGRETPPARSRSWFGVVMPVVAGLAIVVAVAALWAPWRNAPAAAELTKFEIFAPEKTTIRKFQVSPNGRMVAFNADSDDGHGGLWLRSLDSTETRRIANTDTDPPLFFWSNDSRFLAFGGGGSAKLLKVDISGGPPEPVVTPNATPVGGSWDRSGVLLFGSYPGVVQRTTSAGGGPSPVTAIEASRQEAGHYTPVFLPDGKHFLYFRSSAVPENNGIYLGALDLKPEQQSLKRLVATNFSPVYAPSADSGSGYVLFQREDSVFIQSLNLSKLELTGEATRLLDHVCSEYEFGCFSASTNGVLAYRNGGDSSNVGIHPQWLDRQGKPIGESVVSGINFEMALSPDGTREAIHRVETGTINGDVWVLEFARNNLVRLTSDLADDFDPVWSPDGSQIAFASNRGGGPGFYRKASNGTGTEEKLLPGNGGPRNLDSWSRDGNFLIYSEGDPKTNNDLWVLPLTGDRKPTVYLNSEFNESQGQFSPDSHWVAYVSDETGRSEIYVQPFPIRPGGPKFAVSNMGGLMPRWSRDGKELYFLANGRDVMTADVTSVPAFKIGVPKLLFQSPLAVANMNPFDFMWDVADGKKFLVSTLPLHATGPQPPITVVLNWLAMLKK